MADLRCPFNAGGCGMKRPHGQANGDLGKHREPPAVREHFAAIIPRSGGEFEQKFWCKPHLLWANSVQGRISATFLPDAYKFMSANTC